MTSTTRAVNFDYNTGEGITFRFSTWNSSTGHETSNGTEVYLSSIRDVDEGISMVEIPSTVTDQGITYTVTGIGSPFSGCEWLTQIIIPNTVVSIGSFAGCSNLTSITIPNGMTAIRDQQFAWSGLTSIDIPSSVKTIGQNAFSGCRSLESINLPENLESIGWSAFSGCSKLKSLVIPNNIASIGIEAFLRCTSMETVTIPGNNISIGWSAFEGCSSLQKVITDDIEGWCKISFGFEGNPLSYAHHLYIGEDEVHDLVIPNSIEKINSYAFEGCTGLTSVSIHANVKNIGFCAFNGCTGLEKVIIEDLGAWCNIDYGSGDDTFSPLYYAHHLFLGNEEIAEAIIPDGITSIRYEAFQGFGGTSIKLPSTITSIGELAFSGCSNLTTVRFFGNLPSFGDYVFSGCNSLQDIYCPAFAYSAFVHSGVFGNYSIHPLISITNELNTYCSTESFSLPETLKAYIASGFSPSTGELLLTRVYKVPAGEGVLLKGEAGEYEVPYGETDMVYSNLLKGVTAATTIAPTDGDYTNFILADGTYGIGFYTLSQAGEIAAGKAYLQLPTSALSATGSRGVKLRFDDEDGMATAIDEAGSGEDDHQEYFDMQGRSVPEGTLKSGIYIVRSTNGNGNGKKIFIK